MENNRRIRDNSDTSSKERANRRRRQKDRQQKMMFRMIVVGIVALIIGGGIGILIGSLGGGASALEEEVVSLQTIIDTMIEEEELEDAALLEEETAEAAKEAEKEEWYMRLVNQWNPISEDEVVELGEIEGFYVDARIVDPLTELLEACRADGIDIYIRSAYREWDTQALYFGNMIELYANSGYSYYDSYLLACEGVAVPGESEHQLGLAVDMISSEYETLDEGQADTDVARWLEEYASEYGFILRYPEGKQDITGIMFEPWHYRYVGVDAATYIMDNDLTLEEYLEL